MAKEKLLEPESELEHEPPLTDGELIELRWQLFGKCPNCGAMIKGWSPPSFNPERYIELRDEGIDALSGHRFGCEQKWLRSP